MKNHLKSEMVKSMDALHFSEEEKNAMVCRLLAESRKEEKTRHSKKRLAFTALAAAIAVAVLTGAALFTRWSYAMQVQYHPTEEIKKQAEQSGLSVMLEKARESSDSNEVLSVTENGITITAVQSIVDQYGAELTFRIEGFDLPKDRAPAVWPIVSIDGDTCIPGGQTGAFFNGLTRNKEGQTVYASSGQPVKSRDDIFHTLILEYAAPDGSLEYTHIINFENTDGRYLGKEIEVTFPFVGLGFEEKAAPMEPVVEGNWTLRWTLTGTTNTVPITIDKEIGDSDVLLLDAEIGQHTVRARYQMLNYQEDWTDFSEFPQTLWGVRLKDGSEHICGWGSCAFENQEKMIYFTEYTIQDVILDPSQVESLMFHKGWEMDSDGHPATETFYYIPVTVN